MPKVEWTPQAEQELEDILVFVAVKDSRPQTAIKIEQEIHNKLVLYSENPKMGSRLPELPTGVLTCLYKRWAILYRPIENGIQVLNGLIPLGIFKRWNW